MAGPTLSWLVNDAGAYVLAISAVPAEHLHRPLVITVGDDTVLDETNPVGTAGWCAWCEEAEAPTYIRGDGHDPECPLQRRASCERSTSRRAHPPRDGPRTDEARS